MRRTASASESPTNFCKLQALKRAIIDKENFEPGGTLEERVSVLEEVLQEQVMAVREEEKGGN